MVDVATRRTMCTLVAAAFIDGKFDNAEKAVIYRRGRELGMQIPMIDELIDLGRKGSLTVSIPPTQKQKEDLLEDLIDVACADGRLEPAENHLLMKFAGQLGLAVHDLGERVRRRMGRRRTEERTTEKPKKPEPEAPVVPPTAVYVPPPPPTPAPFVTPARKPAGRIDEPVGEIKPTGDLVKPLPPGPIQLDAPSLGLGTLERELGPITTKLVQQTIEVDGREAGVEYLVNFCSVPDRRRAEQLVETFLRENPSVRPGASRIRTK